MKAFCGCLTGCYGIISILTLLLVVYCMLHGTMAVNAWNLTAFLWMPIVVLFAIVVVVAPLIVIGLIAKILF